MTSLGHTPWRLQKYAERSPALARDSARAKSRAKNSQQVATWKEKRSPPFPPFYANVGVAYGSPSTQTMMLTKPRDTRRRTSRWRTPTCEREPDPAPAGQRLQGGRELARRALLRTTVRHSRNRRIAHQCYRAQHVRAIGVCRRTVAPNKDWEGQHRCRLNDTSVGKRAPKPDTFKRWYDGTRVRTLPLSFFFCVRALFINCDCGSPLFSSGFFWLPRTPRGFLFSVRAPGVPKTGFQSCDGW